MNRLCAMVSALAAMLVMPSLARAEAVTIDIQSADAKLEETTGRPMLVLLLSADGQEAFAAFTSRHVGQTVDLLVDGVVITSPSIQSPVLDRWLALTGSFPLQEAKALADRLNRLAVEVTVQSHPKQKNRSAL